MTTPQPPPEIVELYRSLCPPAYTLFEETLGEVVITNCIHTAVHLCAVVFEGKIPLPSIITVLLKNTARMKELGLPIDGDICFLSNDTDVFTAEENRLIIQKCVLPNIDNVIAANMNDPHGDLVNTLSAHMAKMREQVHRDNN